VYFRNYLSKTTRLVSVSTNSQPAAQSLIATEPRLNASTTPVVFDYAGSDLVAGDLNEASDVFAFDASNGSVRLISRALPERPALAGPRGVTRELNSISADGTKVTFTAVVTTNREVFVANLLDGRIEQVSSGDALVGLRALQGLLSGNGQFALYFRDETATPFSTGALRLFRRNLDVGTSEYVDTNSFFGTSIYGGATLPGHQRRWKAGGLFNFGESLSQGYDCGHK